MILWKFKEDPEIRGEDYPNSDFRWVLATGLLHVKNPEVYDWYIELVHQCKSKITGEWESSHTNRYSISLANSLAWGADHFYYDGPHCMYSLGLFRFQWTKEHCKKCWGK